MHDVVAHKYIGADDVGAIERLPRRPFLLVSRLTTVESDDNLWLVTERDD